MFKRYRANRGITLIEILVSIGILAILLSTTFIFMNPGKQLSSARDSQRASNLNTIMNAIRLNRADNRTGFTCSSGDIPTSSTKMANSGGYNIAPCLVPSYIPAMPFDPTASGAHYVGPSDYDTGYYVQKNPATGQVILTAPAAEGGKPIYAQ